MKTLRIIAALTDAIADKVLRDRPKPKSKRKAAKLARRVKLSEIAVVRAIRDLKGEHENF